jgi:hypothetical protein
MMCILLALSYVTIKAQAWITKSGHINIQNNREWLADIPWPIPNVILHGINVGVDSAANADRILRPMFLLDTISLAG